MTQPHFRMAQPRVIFIHWLYFAKLKYFAIADTAQLVEHLTDDLEITGLKPLYATVFPQTIFACRHTSLQMETNKKNDWSVTNQIEYTGLRKDSYL